MLPCYPGFCASDCLHTAGWNFTRKTLVFSCNPPAAPPAACLRLSRKLQPLPPLPPLFCSSSESRRPASLVKAKGCLFNKLGEIFICERGSWIKLNIWHNLWSSVKGTVEKFTPSQAGGRVWHHQHETTWLSSTLRKRGSPPRSKKNSTPMHRIERSHNLLFR